MDEKETVDKFLTAVFDEALIKDLKQMVSHPPPGLDFGIIILVCSGIDLIGALDQGHLRGKPGGRFGDALENYFPNRYHRYKKTLWNFFRCGVAHQAFIKPGTATARNPDYKQYHLYGVPDVLFIHPDVFAQDFFEAVGKFRDSLKDNPEKIKRAFQTIYEIYKERRPADEKIEPHRFLPDSELEYTRAPQLTYLSLPRGSIEFEESDC